MSERNDLSRIKCTCGHVNPPGTSICEACGRPLDGGSDLLNMRYEGMARRSQVTPRTPIDYIWRFFASVTVAVWMIAIALLASIIGTLLPQEQFKQSSLPAEIYYPQTYGWFGEIYYRLGFHQLFYSWWFITLLLMIGISLVVCSIDRAVPLYKALQKKRIPQNDQFLRRQRLFLEITGDSDVWDKLHQTLQKKRYHMATDGKASLFEKGRVSRWGPYINHIGLILLILAFMLRFIPGYYLDDYVWLWDGQTRAVPGTPYYVKSEGLKIDFYTEKDFPDPSAFVPNHVKSYQTDLVLYKKEGEQFIEIARGSTMVNHPFEYEGLYLYQSGEQANQLKGLKLEVLDKQTGKALGEITLDLYDPPLKVDMGNGYTVSVLEYYPELQMKDGKPYSETTQPNRPAFILEIKGPEVPQGEKNWVIAGIDSDQLLPDARFKYKLAGFVTANKSGLSVRIDRAIPYIYAASFIVIVGLFLGFYFQHRRIWLMRLGNSILIAAHTNKNWFGLKRELMQALQAAHIEVDPERIEHRRKTA